MEVDCEGCAGCCIDWRPLRTADDGEVPAPTRRSPRAPLDDAYNLVPLTRDEVRRYVADGRADALTARLFRAADDDPDRRRVTVDGVDLAALPDGPAFFVGLRTVPKPVGPFGAEPRWLRTCAFLDPTTLQCRQHGDERYPATCADYPREHLALDVETECERVEDADGGRRLLDGDPEDAEPLLGPEAVGAKLFVHPDPDRLTGAVERFAAGRPTPADRAEFVAVAAAASPGTTTVDPDAYERARERALAADSWVGRSIRGWRRLADAEGSPAPDPRLAVHVEDDAGAPGTPGWEGVADATADADETPSPGDD